LIDDYGLERRVEEYVTGDVESGEDRRMLILSVGP
jgi:hypothetical protein